MPLKTICIFGAGAIGSHLGARLALAGTRGALVARGPHYAAMRDAGLRLVTAEGEVVTRPTSTDDPATLPLQDYIILTVKTPALPAAAKAVQPLIGPDTVIVAP